MFPVDRILLDPAAENHDMTARILGKLGDVPVCTVRPETLEKEIGPMPIHRGKRILYLSVHPGDMVKPCPGTGSPYLCCRYTVINQTTQCPMDCTYCVLQTYLEHPFITIFVNTGDVFDAIDRLLEKQPERLFRFGTGELGDSLALDPVTGFSADLLGYFSGKRNCIIELKTKTDQVETVIAHPVSHAVISWSVNPPDLIAGQEFHTASLNERLDASALCQDHGFLTGYHFDPIIFTEGWEKMYEAVVDAIFSRVDGSRIAWISLGSLRFPPSMKYHLQKRFPAGMIGFQEMVRGMDGKFRYPRPLRTAMFRRIYRRIREHDAGVFVYFCMEPPWVWRQVTGDAPASNSDLDYRFARSLARRFGHLNLDAPSREAYRPA